MGRTWDWPSWALPDRRALRREATIGTDRHIVHRPALLRTARVLRMAAGVLAAHGLLLALFAQAQARWPDFAPDWLGEAVFFLLALPALLLTTPFEPLLWHLGLMNAPGWFAWPKAAGMALAYGSWVVALLVLSRLVRKAGRRRNGSGATPSGPA
jgi:hypothetical protein